MMGYYMQMQYNLFYSMKTRPQLVCAESLDIKKMLILQLYNDRKEILTCWIQKMLLPLLSIDKQLSKENLTCLPDVKDINLRIKRQ